MSVPAAKGPAADGSPRKPDVLSWREFSIAKVERPSASIVVFRLGVEPPGSFPFQAGQFVYFRDPFDGEDGKKAYSISSPPSETSFLEFCVKKVAGGPYSSWLYDRAVGDRVTVSRALGGFRFRTPSGMSVVLLAAGSGIGPVRSILLDRFEARDDRETWLFYGAGNLLDHAYHDEFVRWAKKRPRFHYVPVLSHADASWTGARGWVQDAFRTALAGRTDFEVYICGVQAMVVDAEAAVRAHGVPASAIHFEKYV